LGKEVATLTVLSATSSVAYDPSLFFNLAQENVALESIYIYGLSASDWIRIVSALALLSYIVDRIVRLLTPVFKFIGRLFK
jgi:hypothetical protein